MRKLQNVLRHPWPPHVRMARHPPARRRKERPARRSLASTAAQRCRWPDAFDRAVESRQAGHGDRKQAHGVPRAEPHQFLEDFANKPQVYPQTEHYDQQTMRDDVDGKQASLSLPDRRAAVCSMTTERAVRRIGDGPNAWLNVSTKAWRREAAHEMVKLRPRRHSHAYGPVSANRGTTTKDGLACLPDPDVLEWRSNKRTIPYGPLACFLNFRARRRGSGSAGFSCFSCFSCSGTVAAVHIYRRQRLHRPPPPPARTTYPCHHVSISLTLLAVRKRLSPLSPCRQRR